MQLLQAAPASQMTAAAPSEHEAPASSAVPSTADADEKATQAAAAKDVKPTTPAAPPSPLVRPQARQEARTPPAASKAVDDYLAGVYADSHRRSPRGPRWCDLSEVPETQAEPETLIPVPGR